MRVNERTEKISVQREEEGPQEGALRDPSSERARFRHRSTPSYPLSAVVKPSHPQVTGLQHVSRQRGCVSSHDMQMFVKYSQLASLM